MEHIETERLILRELQPTDDAAMFALDADPAVHRYLGNSPIVSIEQARATIAAIRQQYAAYGIGRWATIEKSSNCFIGWSGLKLVTSYENNRTHFHDIGYRLMPKYWGKGYATESAKAAIDHGFQTMGLAEIIGMAHEENRASRKALEKCGLVFVEQFKWKDITCDWLAITRADWMARTPNK